MSRVGRYRNGTPLRSPSTREADGRRSGSTAPTTAIAQALTARFSVIDPHRMMQACGLTDRFVRTGIIASTYGQLSVNATRCKEVACSLRSNTLFIEPGAPWEDAYSESFISRLWDE